MEKETEESVRHAAGKAPNIVVCARVCLFVTRSHVSCDDHAAQLVYDEHVQLGGGLAELLLQDLQDGLHDPRSVPQSHRDVAQGPDGVFWDQVSIPGTQH